MDASATGAGGLGVGAGLSPDLLQAINTTDATNKRNKAFFHIMIFNHFSNVAKIDNSTLI